MRVLDLFAGIGFSLGVMKKRTSPEWGIVDRTTFERVVVVCPMAESKQVMGQMHAQGWRITRQGPYTDEKMYPTHDVTRFLIRAEKEI